MALAEPSLTEGTKKLTVVAPTKVDIREVNKQINTKKLKKYNKQTVAVTYIDIGQSKRQWQDHSLLPQKNKERKSIYRLDQDMKNVEEICKQSMELGAEEHPFFVTAIKCVGMECLKWFRIFRYI